MKSQFEAEIKLIYHYYRPEIKNLADKQQLTKDY